MSPEEAQMLERDSRARQAERTSGVFERADYETWNHVADAKEQLPKVLAGLKAWLNTPAGRFAEYVAERSR